MEILFKAKSLATNDWIQGNVFFGDNGKCEICIGTPVVRITHEVEKETVCQYTGKTDKNGNKVFNSDIIYDPHENARYVVFWNAESAGFVLKKDWICRSIERVYYCEVIGNMCDKE